MLMRFDTFGDVERIAQELWGQSRTRQIPMDAYRRSDNFVANFDVPGVDPESIEVTVEKNVLTVKAERGWPAAEGDEVVIQERPQGQFSRQILLGDALDTGRLTATCADGVLTVMLPVSAAAKPRKVTIGTGVAAPYMPAD